MTKKAIIDARQVELRNKTKVLGTEVREKANVILNRIDQEFDYPLRIHASFPNPDSRLIFSMSPLDLGDGAKQVLPPVSSQVWELPESSIDFQTQATTGTNFLVSWPTSTVGFFRRAGFTLLGNGEIQVLFSPEENLLANLANAGSLFVKSGLPLGYIDLVATNALGFFKTASSTTNIIENTNLYRFGSGAGTGGGTGDANELLERLKNRLNAGIFGYLTANIFSLDAENKIESSTASYNIVDETYFFANAGNNIVSKQKLDQEFLEEGVDIEKAEVIAYWDADVVDPNATYELSRDGGTNWQTVNVERVGASETFRGIHTFSQEPTNAYQQTLGTLPSSNFLALAPEVVNNANNIFVDNTRIFASTNSGLFISTDNNVSYIRKTTADGLPSNVIRQTFVSGSNWYLATNAGVAFSTDNGATFSTKTTLDGLPSNNVNWIDVSGSNWVIGTNLGLSFSLDNGATFSTRTTANGLASDNVAKVKITLTNQMYCLTGSTFNYASTGFPVFNFSSTAGNATDFVVDPSNSNRIYFSVITSGSMGFNSTGGTGVITEHSGGPVLQSRSVAISGNNVYLFAQGAVSIWNKITPTPTFISSTNIPGININLRSGTASGTRIAFASLSDGAYFSNNSNISYNNLNSFTPVGSYQQALRSFIITNTTTVKSVSLNIQKTGTPNGNFYIRVVKDDMGFPSSNSNDIVAQSPYLDISALVSGVIDIPIYFISKPGTYHVVILANAQYTSSYSIVNNIAVGSNSLSFNQAYTLIQGRELNLRLRITSSVGDVDLRGYGVFYKNETLVESVDDLTKIQRFSFIGNIDNPNQFVLNWIPDPRFLYVYEVGEGKVYRYGFFLTNGDTIVFEPNTFNKPGNVTLEFVQIVGSFDGSDLNSALLAANHLGSTNATLDFSAPGRGIFIRRPDGTLRELLLNNDDDLEIWSV
jgi:hypothetical protein